LSEAERRNLTVRQGELSALAQHPSWPVLQNEVNAKQARIERVLVAKALSKDGLDPDDGAYLRGFIHGMRWFAAVPEQAEGALEAFLKRQDIDTPSEGVAR
jgi:hypothetical protein